MGIAASSGAAPPRAGKPPLFGSLRARLIASHGFVLLLALALVLAISAAYLRRDAQRVEVARLTALAIPVTVQTGELLNRSAANGSLTAAQRSSFAQLLDREATEWNVRLLIFDPRGIVRFDTATSGNLAGQTLTAYAPAIAAIHRDAQRVKGVHHRLATPAGSSGNPLGRDRLVLVAGSRVSAALAPRLVVGVASPPSGNLLTGRYVPRLLLALAAALLVASLLGYVLSRRIAAPVDRLTAAADAMAAGNLEQRVPGEGPDELGRLVASFNAMSRQVAATARSQRDLLANIAHELRTPLTSVQGYTQALHDGVISDPDERTRALATIGAESARMGELIGQLLDLSRLESGQTRLTPRVVPVRRLLAGVTDRFRLEAERRGITLTADAPADLAVRGDEERLAQIVGNLVGNALRFSPAGGRVELTGARLTVPGGDGRLGVRLAVRDTGAGIPAARLPRIFDRFERGDGPEAGFGLGLAIVRELVQAHGGAIAVQSEIGRGTTFTIDLPAAPTVAVGHENGREPQHAANG